MTFTPDQAQLRESGPRHPSDSAGPETVGDDNNRHPGSGPDDGVPDVLGSLVLSEQEGAGALSLRLAPKNESSPWKQRLAVCTFAVIIAAVLGIVVISVIDPPTVNVKAPNVVRKRRVPPTPKLIPPAPPPAEPEVIEDHKGSPVIAQQQLEPAPGSGVAEPKPPAQAGVEMGQSDEQDRSLDPIEAQLDKSKEEYRRRLDKIKADVIVSLGKSISAARKKKKGNAAIVEKLTAERGAFEEDMHKLPPSIDKGEWFKFANRMKAARAELHKAHAKAIAAYTSAGQDAQAGALRGELGALRSKSAVTIPNLSPSYAIVQQPNVIVQVPPDVSPELLVHTEWNFTRRADGLNQSGAFKILDGVIYHLNAPDPVGEAALDAAGQLHLRFLRHRKIAGGEALVARAAPGEWRGVLDFLGILWEFQISRR